MKVGVPGERAAGETRVALIPRVAERLIRDGIDVCIEAGAGKPADWTDDDYRSAGCSVQADRAALFDHTDVVLCVRALGAAPEAPVDRYRDGQAVIGMLGPYALGDDLMTGLLDRRVSAFALELVPRTGRAQSMDVLSSMASVGGYKAVVMAADALPKLFPLQMTAAGTVRPAEVFVVGAGVAGLQAIATAKRMGASVSAYDIRPEVAEEVESLGADFVDLGLETEGTAAESGYAREQNQAFYRRQREVMAEAVTGADVVITSAAVPGRPAPVLVSTEMIEGMDAGSVIVDLGAEGGGNCEPTKPGETIDHEGVTIFGPTNLPADVHHTASQLYATNVANFLDNLVVDGEIDIDPADPIVDATLLTHDGVERNPHRRPEPEVTEPDGK